MNFKKTWKRANDGFTLVELIVVIAILAILAGIAVPAYSGYIKKANEAADHQVLAAVNTAFAAAVLENGDDFNNITYAKLDTTANGEGVTINGIESVNGGKASRDKYNSSFATYMSGSVATKVISEFDYVRGVGFVDKDSDIAKRTISINGVDYQLNAGSIEAFKGSVYSENVDGLQDQLNSLSTSFSQIVGDSDLTGLFGEEFNEYVKDLPPEQRGNAAVLYVAEKAGSYDAQEIGQLFTTAYTNLNGKEPTMRNLLDALPAEDGDDALVNIAMMYGAVTAYANTDNCPDSFKTQVESVSNGQDLINVFMTLANPGEVQTNWDSYIGTNNDGVFDPSDTFTQDVSGFLGAMDAIDSVSGGLDKSNTSLWNDAAMDELLAELLK